MEDINNPQYKLEDCYKVNRNRFLVCAAVSKRARQLEEGAKPLVKIDMNRPFNAINVAIKEFVLGEVTFEVSRNTDNDMELLAGLDKTLDEELEEESKREEEEKEKTTKKSKRSTAV
jgi:DNA-directed RNA polymerase subunit K/omega